MVNKNEVGIVPSLSMNSKIGIKLKNIGKKIFPKLLFVPRKVKKSLIRAINSEKGKQIRIFVVYILAYGAMVNYVLWVFDKSKMSILTVIAFGVIVYLIREEFVKWIRRIFVKYKR